MKTKYQTVKWAVLALPALLIILNLRPAPLFAEETKFTYQGQLNGTVGPATGVYDFTFTIYDLPTGNGAFAVETNLAIGVTNGRFTTTIDFGQGSSELIFSGPERWLEIAVRTNGFGQYVPLSPRQRLTATPYAITAANVISNGLAGGIYSNPLTFNNPANSFFGNGSGLTSVNATTLNGFGYCNLPCYWNLTGNGGTTPGLNFLGTTDNQPLTLKVKNVGALQIKPGTTLPNIVAGLASFRPTVLGTNVSGVVIAGGNAPSGPFTGGGAGDFMAAYDDDGAIGGGFGNKVGSNNGDPTDAAFATVGGGIFNGAANFAATVGGGAANLAGGSRSVVAGGNGNTSSGDYAAVGGGSANVVTATGATIAGGQSSAIQFGAVQSTIGGGFGHVIQTNSMGSTIGGGKNNAVNDYLSTNTTAPYAAIAGGEGNTISPEFVFPEGPLPPGDHSVIGGGYSNTVMASQSVISGGASNNIYGGQGVAISGGANNGAYGLCSTIPGGQNNEADGSWSFAAGRRAKAVSTGAFVWADSQNADFSSTANDQFSIRAQGGIQLSPTTSLFCGTGLRQMLNLFGTDYGIGVQGGDEYFRSPADFCWFKGGVHNDGLHSPGAGGIELMRLDNAGNLNVKANVVANSVILTSDRDTKENFVPVDAKAVLAKVASLPITEWDFKGDSTTRHIGPMAQDFHAAFGLNGADDKHLAVVDEGGVALAAIQGLDEKVESENAELRSENRQLKQRLERLEKLMLNQKSN